MNVLSDLDIKLLYDLGGSINGTFSFDALFLFQNFQTDILHGTTEGRWLILISSFDCV